MGSDLRKAESKEGNEEKATIELTEQGDAKGPYQNLPPDAIDAIEEGEISNYVEAGFNREGNVEVSPTKYVGVANLPGGVYLEIEPKASDTNFLPLLQYARGADAEIIERQTTADTGQTFLESIAVLYAEELDRILRLGVYKDYTRRQETAKHLRGRLDQQRQIRKQEPANIRFEVEYDEFTSDIPLNQALYRAAELLNGMVENRNINSRLTRQRRRLRQHITPRAVQAHEFSELGLTHLNSYYENALRIAEMMIRNSLLGHRETENDAISYGFFIDMNDFFEEVVGRATKSVAESMGYKAETQDRISSIVNPEIGMFPDVALRDEPNNPILIIDAKWKTDGGVKNQDIYQMISYQLVYDIPGLILYPGHDEGVDVEYEIRGEGRPPLHAKTLPTDPDSSSATDLIRNLEGELELYFEDLLN